MKIRYTIIHLILISELTRSNYKLDMSTHILSTSTDNDNEISSLDSKIRYERILVPHDGSEMSDRALRHAVYLSKISGTEIVIFHVIEPTDNILGKRKDELAQDGGTNKTNVRRKDKALQESRGKRSIVHNTKRQTG